MNSRRVLSVLLAVVVMSIPAAAQHDQHAQLGRVSFPTSCDPKVQPEFERGVAMLHSYWFNYAGKTFRSILEQDRTCAMAYWGIALDLLGNSLAAPPSPQAARDAWAILEKAQGVVVKTERERQWLDAIRMYFRDSDNVPVDPRLAAYNTAMEQLVARHPDDFEAQVYYAFSLQASAPKSDLTYQNQLKSATLLERLYGDSPQHPGITHYLSPTTTMRRTSPCTRTCSWRRTSKPRR